MPPTAVDLLFEELSAPLCVYPLPHSTPHFRVTALRPPFLLREWSGMSQAFEPVAAIPVAAPVATAAPSLANPGQRIDSLDLLRGIAILGIFVMNTWTMSLPQTAYTNPAAYNTTWIPYEGFPSGANLDPPTGSEFWDYTFIHLFADMKFITMFSMMFGAGIVLQSERSSKKGRNPWLTHYLRMIVLLMFGLTHTVGFWYGDILTDYAMAGMILAPFRKLPAVVLLMMGMMLVGFVTVIDLARMNGYGKEDLTRTLVTVPIPFTSEKIGLRIPGFTSLESWDSHVRWTYSNNKDFANGNDQELETYRGTTLSKGGASFFEIWIEEIRGHRLSTSIISHTSGFLQWVFPRCGGCLLIGMALYKRRFFHGEWSKGAYATIAGIAPFVGWAIIAVGIEFNVKNGWNDDWYNYFSLWHLGEEFNYWGSLLCTFGYMSFGILVAIWAADPARKILRTCLIPFRAVGRMALTCYLTETLIGTTIFYGHGFGKFGYLKRVELLPIVFGTWIFLLIGATVWLSFFRQGPLEWFWHSLVYWDWRNPRKSAAGPDAAPAA